MNPIRLATRHLTAHQCSRAASRVPAHQRVRARARLRERSRVGIARPVPVRIVCRSAHAIEIENRSDERLRLVRFALAGGGMLGLSLPCSLEPGERLRVTVRGVGDPDIASAGDAMLVLRWFQADGEELLWPIAL
ncbi:hypothetical protein ICL81_09390 [Leucobacter sp. cx-328]|uniref:hypothetical protein n=1 Tax=unclassified Leucobacter TaxID=2621730 RepID=UPI00165E5721|nr:MULTISPECIES: hypothetical protein [unclassified Leucobacter]MBC9944720.1 hypothetical protein [Leucobacter sp. cx-328]